MESSDFHVMEKVREKAAIPSKSEASEVLDDTEKKPVETEKKEVEKPKGSPAAPPVLIGIGVLLATTIAAIFATRKPTNKPKGQTA